MLTTRTLNVAVPSYQYINNLAPMSWPPMSGFISRDELYKYDLSTQIKYILMINLNSLRERLSGKPCDEQIKTCSGVISAVVANLAKAKGFYYTQGNHHFVNDLHDLFGSFTSNSIVGNFKLHDCLDVPFYYVAVISMFMSFINGTMNEKDKEILDKCGYAKYRESFNFNAARHGVDIKITCNIVGNIPENNHTKYYSINIYHPWLATVCFDNSMPEKQ